ncbi:MAG: TonB-dependent receptor, partial [Pseudomonadota bacterium]
MTYLRPTSLTAMAFALVSAGTATAQTATESEADATEDNVIIVTAQKLEQSINDVPVTLTAQTGEDLEKLGVSEIDELSLYVPGLFVQEQSANNPGFVIRGITSDSGSAQQAARVTLYYNGIDISRSRGSYQDLYDLERVEVIKGPQATLFGTAATIGAVSIISARPEPGFSGSARVGYGNFDQILVSGHVNLGNDVIAGRIAGAFKQRDGYVRNIAGDPNIPNQNTAGINQDDLYAQDQLGLRASLRWTPDDLTTVDIIGTWDRQRHSGTPFVSGTLPATGGSVSPFDPVELSGSPFSAAVLGLSELGLDRDVYDLNMTIETELGDGVTLTMINGYREFDSLEVFDADGSPAFYLEFAEEAEGKQFSHETRLSYTSPEWRGFVGLNYFRERGRQAVPFSTEEGTYLQCAAGLIPNLPCVAPDGTVTAEQATALLTGGLATFLPYQSTFENRGDNSVFSLFADATWTPSEAVELTAGVRFLWEDRESFFSSVQPNSVISGAPLLPVVNTGGFEVSRTGDFTSILPRFNILYRMTPELNFYGTISKGRRSPVVDVTAVGFREPSRDNIAAEKV